ncbi:protein of unknown function [Tenacibaculum sp. MAR_2009_124]|nr:protein of unknown function [Tenacibaculum sp. MAR_2009_124]
MLITQRNIVCKILTKVLFLLLLFNIDNVYSKVEQEDSYLSFFKSGTDLIIVDKELMHIKNYVKSAFPDEEEISLEQLFKQDLDIKNIQLFSHGKSGELYLNREWKSSGYIAKLIKKMNLESLQGVRIYGCNFGENLKGNSAVNFLSNELNVLVSASSNITGALGDWVLEVGDYYELKNYPKNTAINLQLQLQDSDNDGVADVFDDDDDNDGIYDCVERQISNSNLESLFKFNGSAVRNSDTEFILTPDEFNQAGSAMSFEKIDFSNDFNVQFKAYMGDKDATGADGVAIIFHNDPNGVDAFGTRGEGLALQVLSLE